MRSSSRLFNISFLIALVAFIVLFITIPSRGATAGKSDNLAQRYSPLLTAIRTVESNDNPAAIGDNGKAVGAYQIHYDYWRDTKMPGTYKNVTNTGYATRCVIAYWQRYCPTALSNGDLRTLAMTHHGGPHGSNDADYWRKIERAGAWRTHN